MTYIASAFSLLPLATISPPPRLPASFLAPSFHSSYATICLRPGCETDEVLGGLSNTGALYYYDRYNLTLMPVH